MKRAFLILLAAISLAAQSSSEVEITAEPHHKLAFENQWVRVFNVAIAPDTATLVHWHRHDYIAVTLGPARVANHVKDKPAATAEFAAGDTRFTSGSFAHAVRDLGPQPYRNVTIELLQDEHLRSAAVHWDEERGLEVLPRGTKQILFVKDAVRVTEFELQPGGMVPEHHHNGPHLLVAVSDADLRSDVLGQGAVAERLKAGDCKWLPANYSHTITNTGAQSAEFVTVEFPE
ncbi:MAG TPA: cupin domain-containing protein [Candidatus Binatia bacterium]|nr:cupin domain-containing protein [Candidatus Binatia bacterium]